MNNSEINYVSTKGRNIYFAGEVNKETTGKIQESILELLEEDGKLKEVEPIKLYINSMGGNVASMFGLIDIILSSKTPIHTYNNGTCASAGLYILMAGHKRLGRKNSSYLLHQVQVDFYGDYMRVKQDLDYARALQNRIRRFTLERTKITESFFDEIVDTKTDYWFFSEEALELGCIDEVI